jgi:lysophospholipase L1-like esterase
MTLALTLALSVGLSFAPIPEAYRPFPALTRAPLDEALAGMLLPRRGGGRAQEVMTGAPTLAAADLSDVFDEPLVDVEAEDAAEGMGAPLSPSATLGAGEARTVRSLERLGKKLGTAHVDIESPCVEGAEDDCTRRALDRFFEAVEALQRGEATAPVRVVHLGDSQIASDHVTDVIRRRLELRYGSGGRGFLFVDRPTKFAGRKVRTGEASAGWEVTLLTDRTRKGPLGFSGARFAASSSRERSDFAVGDARLADLFFATDPKGGQLEVLVDGQPLQSILTRHEQSALGIARIALPAGARTLTLANGGEVSLFGLSLENGEAGVVYDSVGLPGAQFAVYLRAPEETFTAQLRQRDPRLVVLMLGGNEAYELSRGWIKLEDVRRNAEALVDRLHAAAPEADCLMFSPLDAGLRTVGGGIEPRPYSKEVAQIIREVALTRGCGYWDLLTAMGGVGSVPTWLEAGLFHTDLVHPRARGADLMGHLFDFALERARASRPAAWHPAAEPPGLLLPEGEGPGLSRVFAALQGLEQPGRKASSARIVQLGASHTASHMFTDVARAQLVKTFGHAGRGFVAAGRPSVRLTPGGVTRELEGEWTIPDARERGRGEPWGLTGVRAVGQSGAKLRIGFGVDQKAGSEAARLSLYYLETPDMGRMEVRIGGRKVADFDPAERLGASPKLAPGVVPSPAGRRAVEAPKPDRSGRAPEAARAPMPAPRAAPTATGHVRIVDFEVVGTSHLLEVVNLGPGPITLFGASLDTHEGGVVYDALGLPGSTALLAEGYDKDAFETQLRHREADLYVLFYGTNESMLAGLDLRAYAEGYRSLLGTLRAASPAAGCLLIAPTDGLERTAAGDWQITKGLEGVIRTIRRIATEEGCAFWSARAAMGGPFSMRRWQLQQPQLGHEDGIHLTPEGYDALAHAFVDDLLAAYRSR